VSPESKDAHTVWDLGKYFLNVNPIPAKGNITFATDIQGESKKGAPYDFQRYFRLR